MPHRLLVVLIFLAIPAIARTLIAAKIGLVNHSSLMDMSMARKTE